MEFKVIFIGFALHCVLNTVLICKSVITKGQDAQAEVAIVQKENEMLQAIADTPGDIKRLGFRVDNSNGETKIHFER